MPELANLEPYISYHNRTIITQQNSNWHTQDDFLLCINYGKISMHQTKPGDTQNSWKRLGT